MVTVVYMLAFCFIQKESQPAAVEKINDDDDIDTNVTFDQEELDYPASEHERRLTGASSSEMPSVYNTANASPARSFSSGARSPDTVYLSGSEDIPQYIASPVHPVGMPLAIKHSKAGANSPESVVSSQRRIHNDEDQFIARWAPASSSSSTGPSGGVLRKRHSVAASSTAPLEVRSLTTSSSFPTPGGRIEGKPVPNIDSVNKTIDEVNLFGESESRKKDGPLVVEGHIANKEEPKPYDSQGAEALKESLGDNWEMVPAQHQSKGLGREWIAVPTPSITDTKLHAPSSQGVLLFWCYFRSDFFPCACERWVTKIDDSVVCEHYEISDLTRKCIYALKRFYQNCNLR